MSTEPQTSVVATPAPGAGHTWPHFVPDAASADDGRFGWSADARARS